MTSLAFASKIEEPWVLTIEKPFNREAIPESVLQLELDALLMTELEGLYKEFTSVFQFPDYFGKNFNALDECINDLQWLPAQGYLLTIKNAEHLLKKETNETLQGLLMILNSAGEQWATPVRQGEAWDRDEIPFHTVLEVDKNNASDFLLRLKEINFKAEKLKNSVHS